MRFLTWSFILLACPSVWAQPAALVKDIAPQQSSPRSFGPREFAVVGGTLYFSGEDPANGRELWRSDGTPAGTHIVRDIFPGRGSSGPTWLTNVNGTLFFVAFDGEHGVGLWKSDGTAAGTVLVRGSGLYYDNPYDQALFSVPEQLTAVGTRLFLVAGPGFPFGPEVSRLWVSDGTETGTVPVQANGSPPYLPHYSSPMLGNEPLFGGPYLADLGGTLIFLAVTGSFGETLHDTELWRSDGTNAGTAVVKDIQPGSVGPRPAS
jgi:ELWxxDGT repeat protein